MQGKTAKGRGPPGVAGSVSRRTPVNRDWHQFCSPAKRGFLGGKSWRTTFVRWICPPMRVFAYFLRVQKVGRPQAKLRTRLPGRDPASPSACRHPPEKGSVQGSGASGAEPRKSKTTKKAGGIPGKTSNFSHKYSLQSDRGGSILNIAKGDWFFYGLYSLKK